MTHIKRILFLICMGLLPMQIFSQVRSIHSMPERERNSVLIEMTKKLTLKYGPDYYRDEFPPVIKYKGKWGDRFNYYCVDFLYDTTKEKLVEHFASSALIDADNNRPFRIYFGNNTMLQAPFPDTVIPYQQLKDMPPLYVINYEWPSFRNLDSPDYPSDEIRDSLFRFWCNRYVKKVAPDYYAKAPIQLIDTGRYHGGFVKGKKFFRMSYYQSEEDVRDSSPLMSFYVNGRTREANLLSFANGIVISLVDRLFSIVDSIPPTNYGAFFVPYISTDMASDEEAVPLMSLPRKVRDTMLVRKAREVALAIGPAYYREFQRPLRDSAAMVEVQDGIYRHACQSCLSPDISIDSNRFVSWHGEKYYRVRFFIGMDDDIKFDKVGVQVCFDMDTGQPFAALLGNRVLVYFVGLDPKKIPPLVPYQSKSVCIPPYPYKPFAPR